MGSYDLKNDSLVLVIQGPDRDGLVFDLLNTVTSHKGSVELIKGVETDGIFSMILKAQAPQLDVMPLVDSIQKQCAKDGLRVDSYFCLEKNCAKEGVQPARVSVVEPNRNGIVHSLAAAVTGAGGSIVFIDGDERQAQEAGVMFFVTCDFLISRDRVDELQNQLEQANLQYQWEWLDGNYTNR